MHPRVKHTVFILTNAPIPINPLSLLDKYRPESQKPLITAPPQNLPHSKLEFRQSLLDLKVGFLFTFDPFPQR